jgi:hypothetical protein
MERSIIDPQKSNKNVEGHQQGQGNKADCHEGKHNPEALIDRFNS